MNRHDPMLADRAAALEVTFDGHHYHFREFRYERAEDAMRYARAEHAKPGFGADPRFVPRWPSAWVPGEQELALMRPFGITSEEGRFRYGPYRYDRLEDALAFARRSAAPTAKRP